MTDLTMRERMFLDAYLQNGRDANAAYSTAYGKKGQGAKVLERDSVRAALAEADALPPEPTVDPATAASIAQDWIDIYTADPRELITHRRVNCRHCHGIDFQYQWTDQLELITATVASIKTGGGQFRKELAPSCDGGFGFRANDKPHPECPKCFGEGHSDIFVPDFNKLSPKALKLLAGVKVTKDGIQVMMHDQMRARDNLAKHLGMLIERTKSEDPPVPPAASLTPEQLAACLKALGEKY